MIFQWKPLFVRSWHFCFKGCWVTVNKSIDLQRHKSDAFAWLHADITLHQYHNPQIHHMIIILIMIGWLYPLSKRFSFCTTVKSLFLTSPVQDTVFHVQGLFVNIIVLNGLFILDIQRTLSLFLHVQWALGNRASHLAELPQENLSQEQVNPWIQNLIERGQTYGCEKEITVLLQILGWQRSSRIAMVRGCVSQDHLQHKDLQNGRRHTIIVGMLHKYTTWGKKHFFLLCFRDF